MVWRCLGRCLDICGEVCGRKSLVKNKQIEEIYDKFSNKLVKKIISVSNNGKNSDALEIINKIFVGDE